MKHHYFSLVTVATIGLFTLTTVSVPCIGSETNSKSILNHTNSSLTPLPGTPTRKAILDALRKEIKHLGGLKVLFVVKYFKVKEGWAWVHTLPQSPNGKNNYEDVSALLHLKGTTWKVVELACTEEENPQCLSNPEYFSELKKRFPKVPEEILPKE